MDNKKNFAISSVAVAPAPAASGTQLTVTAGHGTRFPTAPFNCTVWPASQEPTVANAEIVRVTDVTGDVLTIEREQEGTSARTILVGDSIAATITAKAFTDIESVLPTKAGTNSAITGGSITVNSAGVSIDLPAYLTTAQPPGAYLTTAMASDASSAFAGTGASVTGGSLTVNTAGVALNLPAYLTTAQPVGAYLTNVDVFQVVATKTNAFPIPIGPDSTSTVSSLRTSQLIFENGQNFIEAVPNVQFEISSNSIRASAYLHVSASASTAFVSKLLFLASNGISWNLTTQLGWASGQVGVFGTVRTDYASSNVTSGRAGSGTTVGTTAGTDLKLTVNTDGVNVSHPKWITTYVNDETSGRAGTGTSLGTTAGTDLVATLNTNGLSVNYPKWITTYVNDLTSGRAGTGTTLATTAGTDLKMTLNTDGLNISYPKWLTTYVNDETSGRAGVGTTLATTDGTDLKATLNTDGLNISYPKWITTYVNDLTSDRAGTNTGATNCSVTVNTSGVSVNVAGGGATVSHWGNFAFVPNLVSTSAGSNTFIVFPMPLPFYLSASYCRIPANVAFTSTSLASTATNNATGTTTALTRAVQYNLILYTQNVGASSKSLEYYTSATGGYTWIASVSQQSTSRASQCSITHTLSYCNEDGVLTSSGYTTCTSLANSPIHSSQWSNFTGSQYLYIPFAMSLTPGNYWVAMNRFTYTTGGKNNNVDATLYGVSQTNLSFAAPGGATNVTNCAPQEWIGLWTTDVAATTAKIGIASVSASTSYLMPYLYFGRHA